VEIESFLSTILRVAHDAIIAIDQDQQIVFFNQGAERIFGYAASEAVGQSLDILLPQALSEIHRTQVDNFALAPEMVRRMDERREITGRRKDGTLFPAEASIAKTRMGEQVVLAAILRDITERKRVEEALRQSNAFSQAVLNSLPAHIAVLDSHGTILAVNEAWKRFASENGGSQTTRLPIGANYLVICQNAIAAGDQDAPVALEGIRTVLTGSQTHFNFEYPCHSSNTQRWFVMRVLPLQDERGGIVISHQDVTQRRLAQESVQLSEARFRALIENSSDGIVVVDRTGKVTYGSPAIEHLLGYSVNEFMGRNVFEFLHPDDLNRNLEIFERLVQRLNGHETSQLRFWRRDGVWIWIEATGRNLLQESAVRGIVVNFRDITVPKQASEALRQSAADLNRAQAVAHIGSWNLDVSGNELVWSEETYRIFGVQSSRPLSYEIFLRCVHPDDRELVNHAWQAALVGSPYDLEHRIVVGDQVKWVQEKAELEFDAAGNAQRGIGTVLDITERKRAELALYEREQRLREIVNAAPFGAHLYELHPDGQLELVGANQSADVLFGLDHNQLYGKTIEAVLPGLANTEIPSLFRSVAEQGGEYAADQVTYTDHRISGVFEIHAIQLADNRIAVFFRNITELARAYDATLEGWSRAMDFRDKETEGHSQRVTEMTLRLASAMGVSQDELRYIRWGALLHDMGKMGVPDHILLKPGELTQEEWQVMHKHPGIAYEMFSPIGFLRPALDIPYCHHEKWDGTGYPRGLAGEQIPLAARIFAVADVWDALRSSRPYRQGWPDPKVAHHIRTLAGTHFDPRVVEVFERLMEKPTTGRLINR
jgi:PAS domain S-box-containing protein